MDNKNCNFQEKINIDELAELSHIALSTEEKQRISIDIHQFMEFAKCLDGYTANENGLSGITLDSLRDDVCAPSEYAQSITDSAKNFADGLFTLPRTVKEGQE